jgi:mono/diheme cytochrome c family protein
MKSLSHISGSLVFFAVVACGGDSGGSSSSSDSGGSESNGTTAATSSDASTSANASSTSDTAPTTSGDSATGTGTSSGGSTTGDPFGGSSVCSRGQEWTMGNVESPFMNPGMACKTCHAAMKPFVNNRIQIGGTVYETGHEPDLCFGIDGVKDPMYVEITDATMKVTQLPVNEGGNFLWDSFQLGDVAFPITAKVVRGDQERVMLASQMDGNCNDCHTENGANGAPGRIVAP